MKFTRDVYGDECKYCAPCCPSSDCCDCYCECHIGWCNICLELDHGEAAYNDYSRICLCECHPKALKKTAKSV